MLFLLVAGAASLALAEDDFFVFENPQLDDAALLALSDTIYVSPDGSDNGSGTIDDPVKTLGEAVSRMLTSGSTATANIWMRGGEYFIDEPVYIDGQVERPIVVRGYANERPVLTGSREVTDWIETSYMGGTVWQAQVDAAEIRALYGDDGARPVSRWPKEGTLKVARSESVADDKFANQSSFYVNTSDVPTSLYGAVVRVLHWWKDELSGVRGYDPASGQIHMNRPSAMTIEKGDEYWLENVLSVSLAPGEWAFDPILKTLYYAPQEGETIGSTSLYVGLTEQLLVISGVSNVTFDRVDFARNAWTIPNNDAEADFPQAAYDAGGAILVERGQHIAFTSCNFNDIGSGCLQIGYMVKDMTVYNCVFTNIGAQAVYVHGANSRLDLEITEDIVIDNNEVNGYGRNFYNAAAVLIIHARNVQVTFNEIHDGTYTAISAGWVWSDEYNVTDNIRVHNNLLYYIGQGVLSDMGAIYLLGQQPNTVVTSNVVHDVVAADYGGWGIYLDEGTAGIHVTHNLVYRCSAQGFHQHNGSTSTVTNNIFAFNWDGQIGGSGKGTFILERNILVGKPYLNVDATVSVKQSDNLKRDDDSLFVDGEQGNFHLTNDPAIAEIGFIPWVYFTGRYGTEQQASQ